MKEQPIRPYKAAMLPNVDYQKLEENSFSLTDLEYGTMECCTGEFSSK